MKKNKSERMSLFRNASICMSLLSWFTTYDGFRNTVFTSNGHSGLTAALASMAIQVLLLGGVLQFIPIEKAILFGKNGKVWEEKERGFFRAGFFLFCRGILALLVVSIIACVMAVSIFFSYISISNNMYGTDFAVNANLKMDGFIRNTVQEMVSDQQEYVDAIRIKLVKQLKEDGQESITDAAKKRAEDYANSTAQLLKLLRIKELVTLDKNIGKSKNGRILKKNNGKKYIKYKYIRLDYTNKLYESLMKQNKKLANTQFSAGLRNKINNINRDKYAIYSEYHHQYIYAVNKYNKWIRRIKKGKWIPSQERMYSLLDFCETIKRGMEELKIATKNIKDSKAKNNTKRLIREALMNMDSLIIEVQNIIDKVESLIKNSYGENSLSFQELISAIGSSATTIEELEVARNQMLEMEGTLLAAEEKESQKGELKKITNLIHNLENYVNAVEYQKKLDTFYRAININYNIVEDEQDKEILNTGMPSKEIVTGTSIKAISFVYSITGSATRVQGQVQENDDIQTDVQDVTSDEWIRVKKGQMAELNGLIYGHPVNLYCSAATRGAIQAYLDMETKEKNNAAKNLKNLETIWEEIKQGGRNKEELDGSENVWILYSDYKEKLEDYQKSYLDTSESEKAINLISGKKELFPYKEKAWLSAGIAVFVDFGAFLIGIIISLVEAKGKKKAYYIDKKKNWLFKNIRFQKQK